MRVINYVLGAVVSIALSVHGVFAQTGQTAGTYTEPNTGITFELQQTWEPDGGLEFGLALPTSATTTPSTEYIGYFVGPLTNGAGWSGLSHGGPMTNSLLLMFWPYDGYIMHSFRYAAGYVVPDLYTGSAAVDLMYQNINATHWTVVYRCVGCFAWDQNGASAIQDTTGVNMLIGWAANYENMDDPSNPNSTYELQHNAQDMMLYIPASATQSSYSAWIAKTITSSIPTGTPPPIGTTTSTSTTSTPIVGTPAPTNTYDYIIVGGGAGGIPLADKLSESGKSVLLIERGPPSSYRWGGRLGPDWLTLKTNASRFDVPGLDNEIWNNSAGIACADVSQMSGCVLGGGTAVNAGLWWHVPDIDWDFNFPAGWKSTDVAAATTRTFQRIPGEYITSMDGKLYADWGYQLIAYALNSAGWGNVTANSVPNSKNRTYSHPAWMYSHGERGGPMATYLVTANARSNFKLIMNTDVHKVVRSAGHVSGVQAQAYANGGYTGIFNVTPVTGRVILSAGTFGTSKILFRSGIGPLDMLDIIKNSTDGPTMINSTDWITLPVGKNLDDHTNTDIVISHPSIEFINYYDMYVVPNASDSSAYINERSGILAQSAPNIAPMMWESIYVPSDGITRQLQWTSRCEGSRGAPNPYSMTLSQYLGRGAQSRGRAVIDGDLNMSPGTLPYLQNPGDVAAVVAGVAHMQAILNSVANLTWLFPSAGQAASDYVAAYPITTSGSSGRSANHWIGTAKLGTDDGRSGGTAVVDLNTKVYGMDNLFVVDASIFPGMMTANPSGMIATVAEHASEKILALAAATVVGKYSPCYGNLWNTSSACATGSECTYVNNYLWQCL